MYKNLSIFAVHYNLKGEDITRRFIAAGIFYACSILIIFGSVPPCMSIMDMLPLRCNATGKAEPFFISAYHNLNNSVMHYTEEQKVEQEKTALFEAKKRINQIFGAENSLQVFTNSVLLVNQTFLQLSCHAAECDMEFLFNRDLSEAIYDISCMLDFFKTYDETIKNLQQ